MSVVSEQTFCIFGCCGLLCLAAILITLIVGVVRVNDIRDDIVRARAAAARLTRARRRAIPTAPTRSSRCPH
jgi:hypothetical protein